MDVNRSLPRYGQAFGKKRLTVRRRWWNAGHGFTWLELLVTVVLMGILLAFLLPLLTGNQNGDYQRSSTPFIMKQWGLAFMLYQDDSSEKRWPPLAEGSWVPDLTGIIPKYVSDPDLLVAKGHPEGDQRFRAAQDALASTPPDYSVLTDIMGESFAYLGHIYMTIDDVQALDRERKAGRLDAPESNFRLNEGGRIIPLRVGAERFLLTTIMGPGDPSVKLRPEIPVLVDISCWRDTSSKERTLVEGTNVLYLDGHVAFVPLGTFPVVPEVMDVLSGFDTKIKEP